MDSMSSGSLSPPYSKMYLSYIHLICWNEMLTKYVVIYSTKALCTKYSLKALKSIFFSFMSVGSCFTTKQVSERDEDTFYFEIKVSSEL